MKQKPNSRDLGIAALRELRLQGGEDVKGLV